MKTKKRKLPPAADPQVLACQVTPPTFDLYAVTAPDGDYLKFFDVVEAAVGRVKTVKRFGGGFYADRFNLISEGKTFGHIAFGGLNARYPKLEVTGDVTPQVVLELRNQMDGLYQVSGVHSCVDFFGSDLSLFARMEDIAIQVKRMDGRVHGEKKGDRDFPNLFHAYVMGSEENTYVSIYKAGVLRPWLGVPFWVRSEVRARPVGIMKHKYASLEPHEIWGATRFTRRLANSLFDAHIEPHPYRPSALPSQFSGEDIYKMARQYNKKIRKYLGEPGHTPETLGQELAASALTQHAIRVAQKEEYLVGGTNEDLRREEFLEKL